MILYTGVHHFRRGLDPNRPAVVEYASASAPAPSWVKIWARGELIEDAWVGPYSPHTWWGGNPLLGCLENRLAPGEQIKIEVGPGVSLRLEMDEVTGLEKVVT